MQGSTRAPSRSQLVKIGVALVAALLVVLVVIVLTRPEKVDVMPRPVEGTSIPFDPTTTTVQAP